jgi:predicted nucleic acid-binding protein
MLTRMPPPRRFAPAIALEYLRQRFELPPAALTPAGYSSLYELAAAKQIGGGAVYDALIAATAKELGAQLLTLDRRALRTYELLGVDYRFVV